MKNNTISFFRNQVGIAIMEATVAAAILGIVCVGVMQVMSNMNKIKDHADGVNGMEEVVTEMRFIFDDEKHCKATFADPKNVITFKKSDNTDFKNDKHGILVPSIFLSNYAGTARGDRRFTVGQKFNDVTLTSMLLYFPNNPGEKYPDNAGKHTDVATLRIKYSYKEGDTTKKGERDVVLKVFLETMGGVSKIISCNRSGGFLNAKERSYVDVSVTNKKPFSFATMADKVMDFMCPANMSVTRLMSTFDKKHADRIMSYECGDLTTPGGNTLQRKTCITSGYVNEYGDQGKRLVNFMCPKDFILSGVRSIDDNDANDRLFSFTCCQYENAGEIAEWAEIVPTSIENLGGKNLNIELSCQARGGYQCGEMSEYFSDNNDRQYRYKCCKMKVKE